MGQARAVFSCRRSGQRSGRGSGQGSRQRSRQRSVHGGRRRRSRARWFGALVVLMAVLAVPLSAQVAGATGAGGDPPPAGAGAGSGTGPVLEVLSVGWDGIAVPGTWTPVRVRVTGAGGATAGAGEAGTAAGAEEEGRNGNAGNASVLRLEVVLMSEFRTSPQATPIPFPVGAYGQELSLPAGVTKEVTLWVPAGSGTTATVRLAAGDRTLAETGIQFQLVRTPGWGVVGALAEAAELAQLIGQVELSVQGLPVPLTAVRLTAASVPANAEYLGALSALVVQGGVPAALTAEQRQAIRTWVAGGGHLVVSGGPGAARAAAVLPAADLPATPRGDLGRGNLAPLAGWAGVAGGGLTDGPLALLHPDQGTVLAGTPEQPLVVRRRLGAGTVTMLAFDPALQPLAGWPGSASLVRRLLEPALPGDAEAEKFTSARSQWYRADRLQGFVHELPPEAFPGWQTIALILGGFTLLVGPLVHLVLWRRGRREWIWVAVPAAAVLASVSLYWAGVGRGGRDVLGNVISHVRIDSQTGTAQQSLAAGFYAPTRRQITVQVPGFSPVAVRHEGDHSWRMWAMLGGDQAGAVPAEPPYRVVMGRDVRIEYSGGEWGMRGVALDRTLNEGVGNIAADLRLADGLVKGTVRNDTPYRLEDAAVVIGQSVARLGTLAPGQSAPVVLQPEEATDPFLGGYDLGLLLFGRPAGGGAAAAGSAVARSSVVVVTGTGGSATVPAAPIMAPQPGLIPERLQVPDDPESRRRRSLVNLLQEPRPGTGDQVLPLSFLSFTRAPVGGDFPVAGDHPVYHLTLLQQPLRLQIPAGPFVLPPGLAPAEILNAALRGWGSGSNGQVSWMEIDNGTVTFGFRPPLPAGARVETIRIGTRQIGAATDASARSPVPTGPGMAPDPAEPDVFRVYDWEQAAWVPLPGGQSEAVLQPAAAYVGADGMVQVQVAPPAGKRLRFLLPAVTFEGSVGP